MKKILSLIIVAVVLFSLSACIGNDDSDKPYDTSTTNALTGLDTAWKFEDYDIEKSNRNIYFHRSNRLYKFNSEKGVPEFFAELPEGNIFNLVVDSNEEYIYYSEYIGNSEIKNLFKKIELQTGKASVIKKDIYAAGGTLYDDIIYFYSVENNQASIMHYDITENTFGKFESTISLDSDGYLSVQDGGLYFQSIDLHRLSLDDTETKTVLKRDDSHSRGRIYQNTLYYIQFNGIEDELYNYELIARSLSDESETTVDRFTVPEEDKNAPALPIYYVLIENDYIYYSFEKNVFRIRTDGSGKEKLADFSIDGEMFMSNNTLYWCPLAEYQGSGVSDLSEDETKLCSLNIESKEYKEIDFK